MLITEQFVTVTLNLKVNSRKQIQILSYVFENSQKQHF
jgi:hypothetical protein